MRSGFRVRPAESNDVAEMAALAGSAAVARARGRSALAHGRPQPVPDPAVRYRHLTACSDRVVLVAEDDLSGAIVGVVVAAESEVGAMNPVEALVVDHMVVAADQRHRGVGRALLSGIVRSAEARGVEHVVVSAVASDRDANRRLARIGFSPLVVRRIAATDTLRRTLGMTDVAARVGRRRRLGGLDPAQAVSRA